MAYLATQQSPAGTPVDNTTLSVIAEVGFNHREDGTFISDDGYRDEWILIAGFTDRSPTIQALRISGGGVIYWYSAYHTTDSAKFEYKRSVNSLPSLINYAATL